MMPKTELKQSHTAAPPINVKSGNRHDESIGVGNEVEVAVIETEDKYAYSKGLGGGGGGGGT